MRVLLLNYEFPPLGGGAGVASRFLSEALVQQGHTVTVVTSAIPTFIDAQPTDPSAVQVIRVNALRRTIHDAGFRAGLTYVFSARIALQHLLRNESFDIVHTFFSLPTGLIHLLPGRHRHIPYIVSLRGSDVPGYDPYNRSLERAHTLLKPITRAIWRRAAYVTPVCQSLKDQALRTNPQQDMTVVPNGVDTRTFYPAAQIDSGISNTYAADIPANEMHRIRLICVSRLIERKGIQHLLHALHLLKNRLPFSLRIFGDGGYRSTLETLCHTLKLDPYVQFEGANPTTSVADALRNSEIFVLPTLAEAFGNVFLEAMACGLPIVGSNVGGVQEVVSKDNGILVEPTNHAAIADAIHSLATHPQRRATMREANIRKATDQYSWQRVAHVYTSLYEQSIQRPA